MDKDNTDIILNEIQRLSEQMTIVSMEGIERGKRSEASSALVATEVRAQGKRILAIEETQRTQTEALRKSDEWRKTIDFQIARKDSGFNRAIRGATDADAKLQADQAAMLIALTQTQKAAAEAGAKVDRMISASSDNTSALGKMIASVKPSTREKFVTVASAVAFAILQAINTYIMSHK